MPRKRPRCIADVVGILLREFDMQMPATAVKEVVLRLSRNGAISLEELAQQARRELDSLSGSAPPTSAPRGSTPDDER